jgi:hypothetical protein
MISRIVLVIWLVSREPADNIEQAQKSRNHESLKNKGDSGLRIVSISRAHIRGPDQVKKEDTAARKQIAGRRRSNAGHANKESFSF